MSKTDRITDVISSVLLCAGILALTRKPAAEQIADIGREFSRTIRVAQGLSPEPDQFELIDRFERTYLEREDADVTELEHKLDEQLGLSGRRARSRRSPFGSPKVSRHRGGPKHDPTWGSDE